MNGDYTGPNPATATVATTAPESTDTWMNPDIIPFTREHERMLTELHGIVTNAAAQLETLAPLIQNSPILAMLGLGE